MNKLAIVYLFIVLACAGLGYIIYGIFAALSNPEHMANLCNDPSWCN